MGISKAIEENLLYFYNSFSNFIPEVYMPYISLGIFIILITIYVIFIWNFYRFLAKRDVLELNLKQYNTAEHPIANKILIIGLFIVEYIIILPIVVFFWFFVTVVMLILLAKEQTIENIILASAVTVGVIRISAYYNENLSIELAKIFPFTILAIAILSPGFFEVIKSFEKISQISVLFPNITIYLIAIIILEFLLRMTYLIMPKIDESDSETEK